MMSPTDPALVDAMASWVQEASSTLLAARADVPHKLLRWREAVRRFGHGHLRHAQSRPVLYPFSGADLLSALSLFSDAPSHTLVAPFPTGDARCFLSAACREQATSAAVSFFQNFADRGGGWTDDTASNGTVGVLPVLLVALHYSGRRVVTIEWYRLTTSIHGIALTCKHHGGSAPGSSGEGGVRHGAVARVAEARVVVEGGGGACGRDGGGGEGGGGGGVGQGGCSPRRPAVRWSTAVGRVYVGGGSAAASAAPAPPRAMRPLRAQDRGGATL